MVDQHAKLSITSDTSSLTSSTSVSNSGDQVPEAQQTDLDYQYVESCDRYPTTSESEQKIPYSECRSTWNERGVFFLTSLGFTTGLHGICLFPMLCEVNGGAAFLVCTLTLYLILGIPLVLLETGLGQLGRQSPAALYPKLFPLLSGLGFSMCWSSIVFSISEACLLSWTVLYIYKSGECEPPWLHYRNYTGMASSAKFFTNEVLSLSSGLETFGNIQGRLVLGLAITWGAVAICLAGGIRHTGKLCYITTPVTFLIAGILTVRGLFLWNENVSQAVLPDWSSLTDLTVWLAAACYVFHSLNLGLGGLTTISSHNKHSTNLIRDVILVCLLHFVWGVAMWLAYVCFVSDFRASRHLSHITTGGPWILFVVIAKGLASLPHALVFAMALYIMVFFVGLSTLLGTILLIVSTLIDSFPTLSSKRGPITTCICVALFMAGIPLTSQAGYHIQLLLSYYTINWPLILYSLCTSLAVTVSYGQKRFVLDLCSISNIRLRESTLTHLVVLFTTVIPSFLVILLLCSVYHTYSPPDGEAPYPLWAKAVGWFLSTLPITFLPLGAILRFLQFSQKQNLVQSLKMLLKPDEIWTENVSSVHHSSSCEKTTMTAPIIVAGSKDFYLLHSDSCNNNFTEYISGNSHRKAESEHSSF